MRTILSKSLGRVCRDLPALVHAGVRPGAARAQRDDVQAFERALTPLMRESPGAVASLLRHPHLSTLVRALRAAGPDAAPALLAELVALISFDLAWRSALPQEVTLRLLPARLVSLASQVAVDIPPETRGATFQNGKVLADLGPGRVETLDLVDLERGGSHPWVRRPYRSVRGSIFLALADNNPLSDIEAHPDKKTPNNVDLGGHDEQEWLSSIRTALGLIDRYLPAMAADIDAVLQQIVPTGFDAEKHLSCSYQEDVGTIYVSLHPSPLTMAEAIIHEVSHNKINALLDLDPIIQNGRNELYSSPIRPDPRPLHGVLLAVHAFMPVARLYELMTAGGPPPGVSEPLPRLQARYAAVARSNRAGMDVLREHARPTPIGKGLLTELAAWETHFRAVG
jgi:HEXXH motif-containing protein